LADLIAPAIFSSTVARVQTRSCGDHVFRVPSSANGTLLGDFSLAEVSIHRAKVLLGDFMLVNEVSIHGSGTLLVETSILRARALLGGFALFVKCAGLCAEAPVKHGRVAHVPWRVWCGYAQRNRNAFLFLKLTLTRA